MDNNGKLEQFLLLGKNARGNGAADLIHKATAEPGVFAFSELTELPGVKEVSPIQCTLPSLDHVIANLK